MGIATYELTTKIDLATVGKPKAKPGAIVYMISGWLTAGRQPLTT